MRQMAQALRQVAEAWPGSWVDYLNRDAGITNSPRSSLLAPQRARALTACSHGYRKEME